EVIRRKDDVLAVPERNEDGLAIGGRSRGGVGAVEAKLHLRSRNAALPNLRAALRIEAMKRSTCAIEARRLQEHAVAPNHWTRMPRPVYVNFPANVLFVAEFDRYVLVLGNASPVEPANAFPVV